MSTYPPNFCPPGPSQAVATDCVDGHCLPGLSRAISTSCCRDVCLPSQARSVLTLCFSSCQPSRARRATTLYSPVGPGASLVFDPGLPWGGDGFDL